MTDDERMSNQPRPVYRPMTPGPWEHELVYRTDHAGHFCRTCGFPHDCKDCGHIHTPWSGYEAYRLIREALDEYP